MCELDRLEYEYYASSGDICSSCNGSGEGHFDRSVCSTCKGSGVDPDTVEDEQEEAPERDRADEEDRDADMWREYDSRAS